MTNHQRIATSIRQSLKLANISVYLGLTSVACFCLFGTLASMATFKDSRAIYIAFHYLTYVPVLLSMPFSLLNAFVIGRYRIIQSGILKLILALGFGLPLFAVLMYVKGATVEFYMSLFLTMIAWFGMPFLFRVNLKKFLDFLTEDKNDKPTPQS